MPFSRGSRGQGGDATWAAVIPVSLGLGGAALALFSWLSEEALKQGTDRFDAIVRAFVHQQASAFFTGVFSFVTKLGDWPVILAGTLALLLGFGCRKRWNQFWLVLITMTGAGILDGVLKLVFHRPRPDPFFGPKPTTYSFPSGHALISLCFYGLVAGLLSLRLHERWQRAALWCAAGCLIGMIGLSRIYLGVHWPSDVLAGYAAALMWMGAIRELAHRLKRRRLQKPSA